MSPAMAIVGHRTAFLRYSIDVGLNPDLSL